MKYVLLVWLLIGGIGEGYIALPKMWRRLFEMACRGLMNMAILSMRMVLVL